MKELMSKAHELTREIIKEFPEVDYKTQLGICISYLHNNKEEKMLSKRAEEIKNQLSITEQEALKLEEVEKYYQEECDRDSKINMNLWVKGSMRRVYIKCDWRCNNQNKNVYFDLTNNWLSDKQLGRQF